MMLRIARALVTRWLVERQIGFLAIPPRLAVDLEIKPGERGIRNVGAGIGA